MYLNNIIDFEKAWEVVHDELMDDIDSVDCKRIRNFLLNKEYKKLDFVEGNYDEPNEIIWFTFGSEESTTESNSDEYFYTITIGYDFNTEWYYDFYEDQG